MYIKSVEGMVYDIRSVEPEPEHEYFVDTNAWYWTTYSRASIPATAKTRTYQSHQYPRFIKKALDKGSILHRCDLSFAELTHTIEDCERQIFIEFIAERDVSTKEYRHSEDEEREQVVSEVESVWGQIKQMSQCLELTIHDPTTTNAMTDLKQYRIDGYDILLLQAMKQGKLAKIVTDDSDFATVPGIEVFTCNRALIELARKKRSPAQGLAHGPLPRFRVGSWEGKSSGQTGRFPWREGAHSPQQNIPCLGLAYDCRASTVSFSPTALVAATRVGRRGFPRTDKARYRLSRSMPAVLATLVMPPRASATRRSAMRSPLDHRYPPMRLGGIPQRTLIVA